jgi:hypothetical protein
MPKSPVAGPDTPESSPFRKVAECLYRNESSGIYYALVKRTGKQYRRSLKTTDRKLAEPRLSDFRQKVACSHAPPRPASLPFPTSLTGGSKL